MNNKTTGSKSYVSWWLAALTVILLGLCALQGGIAYQTYKKAAAEKAAYSKKSPDPAKDQEWVQKLQDGGYILHFRHTERAKWNDVTAFDQWEVTEKLDASQETFASATCLTDRGIEEAKLIGWMFQYTGVEISEVLTSPICRARQTSLYAFGTEGRIINSLIARSAMPEYQQEEFAMQLRADIDTIVPVAGKNAILSGHGGTLGVDGSLVIDDASAVANVDNRSEGGFLILEKVDDRLIARHVFKSPWQYTQIAVPMLPKAE